jgi:hypothetical protein
MSWLVDRTLDTGVVWQLATSWDWGGRALISEVEG